MSLSTPNFAPAPSFANWNSASFAMPAREIPEDASLGARSQQPNQRLVGSDYFRILGRCATTPYEGWNLKDLHSLTCSLESVPSSHSLREIMHVAWRTLEKADVTHLHLHGVRLDKSLGTLNKSRVAFRGQMLGEDFRLEPPGRAMLIMLFRAARARDRAESAVQNAKESIDHAQQGVLSTRNIGDQKAMKQHFASVSAVGDLLNRASEHARRIGRVYAHWRRMEFDKFNSAELVLQSAGGESVSAEPVFIPLGASSGGWSTYKSVRAYITDMGLQLHGCTPFAIVRASQLLFGKLAETCDLLHGVWDDVIPYDGAGTICPDLGVARLTWWKEIDRECESLQTKLDEVLRSEEALGVRADVDRWWSEKLLHIC